MKRNQCGSKEKSATRNLLIAVMGDQNIPYGIPPYKQDKMIEIIESAIKDKALVEILYKCYGLNGQERVMQKDVAVEIGVPNYQVSSLVGECITRLRQSPFKTQLRSLMVSEEELFDKASRSESAERQLETLQAEIAKLKAEKTRLAEKNEILSKECRESWKQVERLKTESKEKEKRVAIEKARAEGANKSYNQLLDQLKGLPEKASMNYLRNVSTEVAKFLTFEEDLNLSEPIISSLHRARIYRVETLCDLSVRSLTRLGVSQKYIKEIVRALAEYGLSLKEA